jgi:two-component system, sensor histidine kinase PdtaS
MVVEVSAPGVSVETVRSGSFARLPADAATALALVLTELLHNAVEHGLQRAPGVVRLWADRSAGRLTIRVEDDGVGVPADFDLDDPSTLGMSIVRTLVESELAGSIDVRPGHAGGTCVVLDLPVHHAEGGIVAP